MASLIDIFYGNTQLAPYNALFLPGLFSLEMRAKMQDGYNSTCSFASNKNQSTVKLFRNN
jgi:hypothetical protein